MNSGRGGYYVPPNVWATMDQNQRTMLLQHRDESRHQENNHSNTTSTVSEVTTPTMQPATSTPNPPQANPGSMIRQMLSNARTTTSTNNHSSDGKIFINGRFYAPMGRSANEAVRYTIANIGRNLGALIDGGTNGGLAGADVHVLETVPHVQVDVSGIMDNTMESLPIVQCAALVDMINEGNVILIMSQYAKRNHGKTIHSKNQLEHFGCVVLNTAKRHGGKQALYSPEGYVVPMHIHNGLFYIDMKPPSDTDMLQYSHTFITADHEWDPSILDDEYHHDEDSPDDDVLSKFCYGRDPHVDSYGDVDLTANMFDALRYDSDSDLSHNGITTHKPIPNTPTIHELIVDAIILNPQDLRRKLPDLESLHPHFGWVTTDRIHDTLEKTSQHYHATKCYPFWKHLKSRFPAANVCRLNKTFSTDTVIMDIPTKDDGIGGHANCTLVQLFTSADSEFTSIYPIHAKSEFPHALQDFIHDHGAMKSLRHDNAKEETSTLVQDILKMYMIRDSQSEPHYQHQNPAEHRIQDVKRMTTSIVDCVGCQAYWWLLCMTYVVGLLNHLTNSKGYIPKTVLTGEIIDISPYLDYHFWQEIFVESPKGGKQLAYWCGPAEKQGDFLTFHVLLWDTEQLIQCSNMRPVKDSLFPNCNQRQPPAILECLLSINMMDVITVLRSYTMFLIGMPVTIKRSNFYYLLAMANLELIMYNELFDLISEKEQTTNNGQTDLLGFDRITDHQGPLKRNDPRHKGSSWNVYVHWDDSEATWEPLNEIAKFDPVTVAMYAHEHGLLTTLGWRILQQTAK